MNKIKNRYKQIIGLVLVILLIAVVTLGLKLHNFQQQKYQDVEAYIAYFQKQINKDSPKLVEETQEYWQTYGSESNLHEEFNNIKSNKQQNLDKLSLSEAKSTYQEYKNIIDEKIDKINTSLLTTTIEEKNQTFATSTNQEQKKLIDDFNEAINQFEKNTNEYLATHDN